MTIQNGTVASSVRIAWKNTRQSVIVAVLESGEMMHIVMKIPLSAQIAMKSITPDAAAAMPCFMRMKHTTRTVMHTVEIVMRKNGKILTWFMTTAINRIRFSTAMGTVTSALNWKLMKQAKMMIMRRNCWILQISMRICSTSRQMVLWMTGWNWFHIHAHWIIIAMNFHGKIFCIVLFARAIVRIRQAPVVCISMWIAMHSLTARKARTRWSPESCTS